MKGKKRIVASLLTLILMVTGFCIGNKESKEVQAATETAEIVEYDAAKADTVKQMITQKQAPEKEGYLFAGWFNSENCTLETAISSTDEVSASASTWAKFVPENVLGLKCQIATTAETDGSTYLMRFVSSVDGLDYAKVGFEADDGSGKRLKNEASTVYERIYSTSDSVKYEFSPKIVDTKSEYFVTAKMKVTDMNRDYEVRAFWVTFDGTKVYGPSRCVCVNDGQSTCSTVNVSFCNSGNIDLTNVTELKANDYGAVIVGIDGDTVHTRVSADAKAFKSATLLQFTLTNGTTVGSTIYRNLYTEYDGTENSIDTSWYTVYQEAGTEFTIATSADLYGFSKL